MTKGIYILSNDNVVCQLSALLYSIRLNYDVGIPIRIIPFDQNMSKVKDLIEQFSSVEIIEESKMITWDLYGSLIWKTYCNLKNIEWNDKFKPCRLLPLHRKLYAWDEKAEFDQFILLDSVMLILDKLDRYFDALKDYDVAAHDYQPKDDGDRHVFNTKNGYADWFIRSNLFCVGFYASSRNLFTKRDWRQFIIWTQKDFNYFNRNAPEQSIINWAIQRSGKSCLNFTQIDITTKWGSSCTGSHQRKGRFLFDGDLQLPMLHYIGVDKKVITRAANGDEIADFPYKELFLDYFHRRV